MDTQTPSKCNLPKEKVFSIQIGSEIFRLSGASIASDAPSYFSRFFEDQLLQTQDVANIRTLYIDRDPTTFREIARHLQGYHVRPQDGAQFVKLFADAQFYTSVRVRMLYSNRRPTLPDPSRYLLRSRVPGPGPPGSLATSRHHPPSVPNRSADVFDELLHLLRGYPLHIRNEDHRASLLRDCRYFHLRGLEQKLIPHQITTNPFNHRLEIVIRLEDVRPSGIQFASGTVSGSPMGGMVTYTRPFVDESAADLVVQIGDESSLIHRGSMRADFLGLSKQRIASLLQTVGKKMNLPDSHPPLGQVPIKIRVDRETDLTVDGEQDPQHLRIPRAKAEAGEDDVPAAKRPRVDNTDDGPWLVRTGQWRLQVQTGPTEAYEVVLVAVKLDIYTSSQVRNRSRKFL
ncbi:unnamed protein product [Penicillium nalgiovense]|nr:unnamed protein product [Penicillium nalgiovense]